MSCLKCPYMTPLPRLRVFEVRPPLSVRHSLRLTVIDSFVCLSFLTSENENPRKECGGQQETHFPQLPTPTHTLPQLCKFVRCVFVFPEKFITWKILKTLNFCQHLIAKLSCKLQRNLQNTKPRFGKKSRTPDASQQ